MALFAKALPDDAAMRNVAVYIESMPPKLGRVTITGDAARGESKYTTCAACHGAGGQGQEALGAPALAGVDDWYLLRQLENFRSGLRGYLPDDAHGQQMRAATQVLDGERDMHDVIAYIVTLEAP